MRRLHKALNDTGYPFEHYGWSKAPDGDYGVYAEDSGEDFVANDVHLERGTAGTVDLFTRDDTSAPRDAVEAVLNAAGASWYLNTIQFEEDTGYIHYEWVVGLYG